MASFAQTGSSHLQVKFCSLLGKLNHHSLIKEFIDAHILAHTLQEISRPLSNKLSMMLLTLMRD